METTAPSKSFWPAFLGAVALILLFAVIVRLLTGSLGPAPDEDAARAAERASALEALRAEDKEKLETTAWADRAKGAVQIPIQRAMELTVAELASQTPRPAGPIDPAAPAEAAPAAPENPETPEGAASETPEAPEAPEGSSSPEAPEASAQPTPAAL